MAVFYLPVGEKEYEMEFTRDSMAKFESAGGTISGLREKPLLTTQLLVYTGLLTHNPHIYPKLAEKITNEAIDEYGLDELYGQLVEKYMEAFTDADNSKPKKKLVLSATRTKSK